MSASTRPPWLILGRGRTLHLPDLPASTRPACNTYQHGRPATVEQARTLDPCQRCAERAARDLQREAQRVAAAATAHARAVNALDTAAGRILTSPRYADAPMLNLGWATVEVNRALCDALTDAELRELRARGAALCALAADFLADRPPYQPLRGTPETPHGHR